jgi:hypothetical protein
MAAAETAAICWAVGAVRQRRSMSLPSVTAVMPTNGTRPKMEDRAFDCFQAQTYRGALTMVVVNSDPDCYPGFDLIIESVAAAPCGRLIRLISEAVKPDAVGVLRNRGNRLARGEIIVHWDDDDWSDPSRITEQVEFLVSSGAEAVGYNTMLFWDSRQAKSKAWRYRSPNPNYCLGSSLMYWRKTWERHPFPAKQTGEDTEWLLRVKAQGVTSIGERPRMVCAIHGANTSSEIKLGTKEWSRAAAYDKLCGEVMGL